MKNIPMVVIPTGEYAGDISATKDGVEVWKIRVYIAIINI
jgi:hypothetical protein